MVTLEVPSEGIFVSEDSFFTKFMQDVEHVIDDHFPEGTILEVRHVRRLMNIPSKNRSKTAFISRALDCLADRGSLECVDKKVTKRYKKIK